MKAQKCSILPLFETQLLSFPRDFAVLQPRSPKKVVDWTCQDDDDVLKLSLLFFIMIFIIFL